jgi:hypothetical protein
VTLDGYEVSVINSHLRSKPERPDPKVLVANEGFSYVGSILLGMGFTLTPSERNDLVANRPENEEKIRPYIGGAEVNSSPIQEFDRYAIDFGDLSLADASKWPELVEILREKVLPERASNKRKLYREKWWRFGEPQLALREALGGLDSCLVAARVSKHLMFCMQPVDRVFSEQLCVFPIGSYTVFGVLQSRIHELWAWLFSSTMRDAGIRYSASDCFSTFPFPSTSLRTSISSVEKAGENFYNARAEFMADNHLGLTKSYNALTDCECGDERIVQLRRLHEEMDGAVLEAYGWADIEVPPYCPGTPEEEAAVEAFNDEVIDRLYVLNAERAAEEERQGLTKIATKKSSKKEAPQKNPEPNPTLNLF